MERWSTKSLLIINGVILLFILFNLTSNEPDYIYHQMDDSGYADSSQYTITQLSENTVLVVNNGDNSSGIPYTLLVLEYDPETNMFSTISDYNTISDFE